MIVVTASTAARPAAVHACIGCAALPERPTDPVLVEPGVEYRPAKPRPIAADCGPRSARCASHKRAHKHAQRARAGAARSRKRSGLDEDTRQALLALQGGRCAGCGRGPARSRTNLDADHDHAAAAGHDHPEEVACEDCMRGFLCRACNRDVLGALSMRRTPAEVAAVLRNLADYLEHPPMARLRAQLARADAA